MTEIYLDNASTTHTDPRVLEAMLPYFTEKYGNANSKHQKGQEARIAIDESRDTIASILNCRASEIIFTGSATEANNMAIFGVVRASDARGKHIVTCQIEHSSVRNPFEALEKQGYEVTWLEVDKKGFVDPETLEAAIRPDTIFVSIMYANNEIGTVEPIAELGAICRSKGVIFHTDAAQAQGAFSLDVEALKVDLLTLNASKIYGPKGVGALYIRKDTPIEALLLGGNHEFGLRAGTHNTPGIVGMAKALELIQNKAEQENARLTKLRNKLINGLLQNIPNCILNGPDQTSPKRLPNNANIMFPGINSQELMLQLDEAGIFVSSSSACSIGSPKPSKVLQAIGISKDLMHSAIRFSLGKKTTEEDIDYVVSTITEIISKLSSNYGFKKV